MYGVRVSCYVASCILPGMTQTPTPHPFLRETSHVPFVLNSPSSGVSWFKCPVATAGSTLRDARFCGHIGNAWGGGQRPVTSFDPEFCYYIFRGFGSLGGHSRSSLAAGIAARLFYQNFFVLEVSRYEYTYKLLKSALYQLSPQRTISVYFCILHLSFHNKPT
jgi:hypothetical protein